MKKQIIALLLAVCLAFTGCACSSDKNEDIETTQQEEIENVVYITDTGSKFHSSGCQYLYNSSHEIDRDEAIAEGYSPCSKCNP